MNDPVKKYARAVAEAVRNKCTTVAILNHDCAVGIAANAVGHVDLDTILASVPAPVMQHHAAPTCVGWWWARRKGKWEAVRVKGWGAGSQDRHVAIVERAGSFTGAVCDAWFGPLLPPDTTEPRCGQWVAPHNDGTCGKASGHGGDHEVEEVATPTPDIDPEEVRRALGTRYAADGEHDMEPIYAAAEAYLRLREQPAPDVHSTGYPATVENIYNDPALNMARHQGRIEGWRRALNERPDMQALLEEEMRLRDKACAAHQAAAYARGKSDVQAQIDAARESWMEPEPQHHAAPTCDIDPETERFARIGRLFCELWEAGAPWPVRHWTCDKHKVKGCLRCKATTAP